MTTTRWAVYPVQRKANSTKWQVRWRVDGVARKRTFSQKGHATTFAALLDVASAKGLPADHRGWPPPLEGTPVATAPSEATTAGAVGLTFEDYATNTWYPARKDRWSDKNRLGHRNNMRFAIRVLRYAANDPRLAEHPGLVAGQSILLRHIVADDVIASVNVRGRTNARTAAKNERLVAAAFENGAVEVELAPEVASPVTVRAYFITIGMVLKAAKDSIHIPHDPLRGVAIHAPKPARVPVSQRIVPSRQEVFDLAEAIAALGPKGADGLLAGERFRSLVLVAGTVGARPGELVAHHPEWFDWGKGTIVLKRSFTPVFDAEEGIKPRFPDGLNPLKHRVLDEVRQVPLLPEVAAAVTTHLERGYASETRTWTSVEGRRLDWGNLMDEYWRPACEAVFGGSSKGHLMTMTPKMLRKAAITDWLDAGIHPAIADDWAGNSEDVRDRFYTGRISDSYEKERGLLVAHGH